jgi:hypothetical protein
MIVGEAGKAARTAHVTFPATAGHIHNYERNVVERG